MTLRSVLCCIFLASWLQSQIMITNTQTATSCSSDEGFLGCLECPYGWSVDVLGTGCVQCPSNCVNCTEGLDHVITCNVCTESYSLAGNGNCTYCETPFCSSCTFDGIVPTCGNCITGYGLLNNTCRVCPNLCSTCDALSGQSHLTCSECYEGYVLNQNVTDPNTCLYCPYLCESCVGISVDGLANCTSCTSTFGVRNGQCQACPDNCMTCHYNNTVQQMVCDQCVDGYGLPTYNIFGACTLCPDNCESCTKDDCMLCAEGYTVNQFGECSKCPNLCKECVYIGTGSTGYTDCVQCDDLATYHEINLDCVGCPAHCSACYYGGPAANNISCSTCDHGYRLDSGDGRCYSCPGNCSICEVGSGTPDCVLCDAGYNVTFGYCSACPFGCNNCTIDITQCDPDGCQTNYAYNPDSSTCKACSSVCLQCDYITGVEQTRCSECKTGYVPDNSGDCLACGVSCGECTYDSSSDAAVCIACADGYGEDTAGACSECPPNCRLCTADAITGDMVCSECYGSYVNAEGCVSCPDYCAVCAESGGRMLCERCEDGYSRTSPDTITYECRPCHWFVHSCVECTDFAFGSGQCTQCETGYVLSSDGLTCTWCTTTLNSQECLQCGYTECPCNDTETVDPSTGECSKACYTCSSGAEVDDSDNYSEYDSSCGAGAGELESCPDGTCWVHLTSKGNITSYKRSCSTQICTDIYKYRVCTWFEDEERMDCSQCCTGSGCNSFSVGPLVLTDSSARLIYSWTLMALMMYISRING